MTEPSLRSLAQSVQEMKPGTRCGVARALDALTGDDADWLAEVVPAASGYSAQRIARILKIRLPWMTDQIIQRHRRGDCQCSVESAA